MKFRFVILAALLLVILSACSLAEDIAPPANYKSPTPAPTLGILFPQRPPSPERGAEFYAVKCAPCHGETGLGNGPMAAQLPVAVPAMGRREIAAQAAPSDWFTIVTQGNLDRGMPGFLSLSDSERWDVVAYTYSLGTTTDELQRGAALYAANCASCHGSDGKTLPASDFTDQAFMARVSGSAIYQTMTSGTSDHTFSGLKEDDFWALVATLRSLTFDLSASATATPEPVATATLESAVLPSSESTPAGTDVTTPAVEVSPTPEATVITINGMVTNGSGTALPGGLTVTLSLLDMTTSSQETQTLTSLVQPDGSYQFTRIPAGISSAYATAIEYQSVSYSSEPIRFDGINLSYDMPIIIFEATDDLKLLTLDQIHVSFDTSTQGIIQVVEVYVFSNTSQETVIVTSDGGSVPFIQVPDGVTDLSLQLASGTAPLLAAPDGFAVLPGMENQYGIVALYSMPYNNRLEFSQPFSLPVASLTVFLPQGLRLKSEQLTDVGVQDFEGQTFQVYQGNSLASGSSLSLTLSGKLGVSSSSAIDQKTGISIAVGILGVLLVLAGIFLFLRDRAKSKERLGKVVEEVEDALGDDPNDIMDAILALDEQFKIGSISKQAYEKRRAELKARLKELL